MTGKTYISIFCCCMNGVFTVVSTFFVISWRWVKNCEADISTIMMAVTTRTSVREALRAVTSLSLLKNLEASGAPKMCAFCALSSRSWLTAPTVSPDAMPLSTWYRAKKNGDCARMGRHEESGLVPVSLYSFIISSD
ncbi:hypothetical protein RKD48_004074 [Streptomyces ambofaciens]